MFITRKLITNIVNGQWCVPLINSNHESNGTNTPHSSNLICHMINTSIPLYKRNQRRKQTRNPRNFSPKKKEKWGHWAWRNVLIPLNILLVASFSSSSHQLLKERSWVRKIRRRRKWRIATTYPINCKPKNFKHLSGKPHNPWPQRHCPKSHHSHHYFCTYHALFCIPL